MKSKVVYVTSDEAQIITLLEGDRETVTLHKHGQKHDAETHGKHQLKKNDDTEHFFHEVATALTGDESRILLIGPAQAKERLSSHIERDHKNLFKSIVGTETVDKLTNPQMVAFGRDYFTKHRI